MSFSFDQITLWINKESGQAFICFGFDKSDDMKQRKPPFGGFLCALATLWEIIYPASGEAG